MPQTHLPPHQTLGGLLLHQPLGETLIHSQESGCWENTHTCWGVVTCCRGRAVVPMSPVTGPGGLQAPHAHPEHGAMVPPGPPHLAQCHQQEGQQGWQGLYLQSTLSHCDGGSSSSLTLQPAGASPCPCPHQVPAPRGQGCFSEAAAAACFVLPLPLLDAAVFVLFKRLGYEF